MSLLKTTPTYEYTRTPLRGDFAKSACAASNDKNGGPELTDVANALNSGGYFEFKIKASSGSNFSDLDFKLTPKKKLKLSTRGGKIILIIGEDVDVNFLELDIKGCTNNNTIEFHDGDLFANGDGAYIVGADHANLYVIFKCPSMSVGGLKDDTYYPVWCR